jgi:hypothetical protein
MLYLLIIILILVESRNVAMNTELAQMVLPERVTKNQSEIQVNPL